MSTSTAKMIHEWSSVQERLENSNDENSNMVFHTFKNGDKMPMLGLGTWKSAPDDAYKAVKEAITIGYRLIDTAPVYDNEKEVGRAIAECIKEGTVERSDLFIISKLWPDSMGEAEVLPALKGSLANLQLDYVDLYMINWPLSLKPGIRYPSCNEDTRSMRDTRIKKTWEQMEKGVDEGLIKHLGLSNYSMRKIHDVILKSRVAPEVLQVERHPFFHQSTMLQFCKAYDVHVMGFSPLGSSDRPDNFRGPEDIPVLLEDPVIKAVAEENGATPAQVVLQWQIHWGTSVIVKSVQKEHLIENFKAATFDLPHEDARKFRPLDQDGALRYIDGSVFFYGPYNKYMIWNEGPYEEVPGWL